MFVGTGIHSTPGANSIRWLPFGGLVARIDTASSILPFFVSFNAEIRSRSKVISGGGVFLSKFSQAARGAS